MPNDSQHRAPVSEIVAVLERRRSCWSVLPRGVAFWVVAAIAFSAFAANAAASPLYRIYQSQFRFSAAILTAVFAVYVLVLLITLLFFGSLSDYIGRRRVIAAGLAAGALGCAMFLIADGAGPLFAARALQGLAVGLISGAASAALHDLRPVGDTGPLVSSAAPTGGQSLGAIGASALAQYAPAPTHLVWWLLLGAFAIGIPAVLAMNEPGTTRQGAAASLLPRVGVPREARAAFTGAVPGLVGMWALGGFYLSLGPSLAEQFFHSTNLLWGGILIFLLTGLGAAASVAVRKADPSNVLLGGSVALVAGALVTFAAIETTMSVTLFIGTAIAGLGFGPAFMGGYRAVAAAAPPGDRAALITAIYLVSYLATGVPAVLAGVAASHYGLHDTARVYSVAVAGLAAAAGVTQLVRRLRADGGARRAPGYPKPPPGPGTVPPCAPITAKAA